PEDLTKLEGWLGEMDLSEALQRQGGDKATVAPTRAALAGSGEDAPSRASSCKSAFFSEALHGCVAEMLSPVFRDGSSTLPAGIDEDFRADVEKHGLPAPRSHYYSELKFVDEARTSIHGDVPDRANHLPEGAVWMPEMPSASDLRLSSVSTQESVSDCSIEVPLGVHVWCPEMMSTTPPDTSPCKAASAATSTVMPQLDLSRTMARTDPAPGHRKVSHAHMSPRPMTQRAAKEPEGVRPGRSHISEIGVSVDGSTLKDQSADTAGHTVAALPGVNPANNGDMAPLAAGHTTSGDACQNDGDDSPEASNGALEASPVLPAKHALDSTRERVSLCAQRVVPAHCVLPARRKLDVSSPLVLTADDDAAVEAPVAARDACPQGKPSSSSPSSFAQNHGDAGDLLSALSSLGGETAAAGRDGPPVRACARARVRACVRACVPACLPACLPFFSARIHACILVYSSRRLYLPAHVFLFSRVSHA
ncbi:MAG: hypothetical protein ACPIOQ_43885, partial [Promethearchaeia archaeon]